MTRDEITAHLFEGGGDTGARMSAIAWEGTPLGDLAAWPQSLVSVLGICVRSRFPIAIYWGPRLTLLYNDAWSPILGDKHPWALGRGAQEVWPEIWQDVGPLFEQVMTTGEATYTQDGLLPMRRHGYTEECYFNFTFTPVRGAEGRVEGVFNAVLETTFRVVSERRTRVLRDLGDRIAPSRSNEEVCAAVTEVLGAASHDVPFCAIYLLAGTERARRASSVGLTEDGPTAPAEIALTEEPRSWPLAAAEASGSVHVVDDLAARFGLTFPGGAWPEPAEAALIAPLRAAGKTLGHLVLGKNPRRAFDDEYRQFVERAATLIATALANVRSYEEERQRAEALAELDRAKTAFFANVSHEFRTPLTLMVGPTEDALASAEGALKGEDLQTVYRNELRLLKLVNSLLEFSRIEAGRVQARYEPVDLPTVTKELAGMFRSIIERGGVRFEVECPSLAAPVHVDQGMWEKIVLNLISNAFKFTFEGTISVRLGERDGHVDLTVADTGTGIPDEELPRLFERFHRVEGARGRTHEGSGIGLALVHDLVKLHGGSIAVTSALGQGTTFTVSLPLGSAHLPAERVAGRVIEEPRRGVGDAYIAEARRWLSGVAEETLNPREAAKDAPAPSVNVSSACRVLIADDNADMRDYLTRILGAQFSVTSARNGVQALAAAQADPPDLVLTDVMMPELDGFGLLRALRAHQATASVPIIMLSARAGEESRVEGLEAGADDYLVKPFSARELLARVTTHLHLAQLRRSAETGRRRFYDLFEQAPVAITVYEGPDLRLAFQNKLSREITRQPDALGLPLAAAFPQSVGSDSQRSLERVFATGQPESLKEVPVVVTNDRGEREERYFTTHRQTMRDERGVIVGVVGIDHEMTEEVKLRRAAQEASRAKDEFLAMLGHELRNPLSPILTALHLLRLRGNESRELAVISRQVGHLTRLVDDLLDISRITRGKVELKKERLELAQPVLRGLEMAAPLFDQRHQRVQCDVPAEGLAVEGDLDRLAQVVSNLLTNASKYSEPGSTVRVIGDSVSGKVRLRVVDEGIGLAPDMLDKVFDPFVQQPQALDRAKGGLGLGLAIVQSLVGQHGGTASAKSAGLGKGSEFLVELPACPDAVPQQPARAPQRTDSNRPEPGAAVSARVLVVDDNEDAAEGLAELLRTLGYETAVAYDGPSALKKARAFTPDVCLLDIGLPVMDGYELAKRLRGSGALSERARLIALTGYGRDADRRRSSEAGFDAHLVKPVDVDLVSRLLRGGR